MINTHEVIGTYSHTSKISYFELCTVGFLAVSLWFLAVSLWFLA